MPLEWLFADYECILCVGLRDVHTVFDLSANRENWVDIWKGVFLLWHSNFQRMAGWWRTCYKFCIATFLSAMCRNQKNENGVSVFVLCTPSHWRSTHTLPQCGFQDTTEIKSADQSRFYFANNSLQACQNSFESACTFTCLQRECYLMLLDGSTECSPELLSF